MSVPGYTEVVVSGNICVMNVRSSPHSTPKSVADEENCSKLSRVWFLRTTEQRVGAVDPYTLKSWGRRGKYRF